MKTSLGSVIVMGLAVVGCASQQSTMKQAPSFVVTTPVVELSPGGKVVMYGTGFAPKQEIMLLLKDAGGGMSGISGTVSPAAVANQEGAWATTWTYTSYLRSLKPGTGMISVVDKDYNVQLQAPVVFVAPPKPKPEAAPKPEAKPAAR